jgi:hypothetical protein
VNLMHLNKSIVIAFVVGWLFAIVFSPAKLLGGFGKSSS